MKASPVAGGRVIEPSSIPCGGAAAATGLAALAVGPVPVVFVAACVGAARAAAVRARRRRLDARRHAALPDLVDQLLVAASAGLSVPAALSVVSPRAPVPLRPLLAEAQRRIALGGGLGSALDHLGGQIGGTALDLTAALVESHRSGAPLVPTLRLLSVDGHDRRTRLAQERARRLSTSLLFPLVFCVLPAAVLLTVVPAMAATLGDLSP